MKTCDLIRRDLLLAASGELPAADREPLDRHLASCRECRRFQEDAGWIAARAPAALEAPAPALDPVRLEAQARRPRGLVIPLFRHRLAWAAAAALLLGVLGGAPLLLSPRGETGKGAEPRLAILAEWQFWMVSSLGWQEGNAAAPVFLEGWNEREFARHLLVLEGLLPEDDQAAEEAMPEAAPGALPPITIRACNNLELLRS